MKGCFLFSRNAFSLVKTGSTTKFIITIVVAVFALPAAASFCELNLQIFYECGR